jgi:Ca-activated chloride channel family protein
MTFDSPLLAMLAPLVGIALGGAAWLARQRRVRHAEAWSAAMGREARRRGRWIPIALGLAGLLAAVALANPRWGRAEVRTQSQALSLVLAYDISRSMLAEDVAPSRLGRAVEEGKRLVRDLRGDRIGLIAFAGRSYILAPLTVDESAIRMYLDALNPELASRGGTDLTAPLAQGRQLLQASEGPADRVLILISDGEGHDTLGRAIDEAEALASAGVQLVIVGVGTLQGARVPLRDSLGNVTGYVRDPDDNVVVSRLEEGSLRAIAEAAGGTYVGPEIADQAGAVRDLLERLQRSPTSETRIADQVPRAWVPALLAALLLLAATLTRRTASLVAIAGLVLLGAGCVRPPNHAARAAAAGDPASAAALYLDEARAGDAPDTAFYNAGTAALSAERLDVARGALDEAARSLDPMLRYRALYNAGTAALVESRRDTARREQLLTEAVDRLQQALLLRPGSDRAKWNLELALRQRPPSSGGGGGGGGAPPSPSGGQRAQPDTPEPPPGLSERQAEQILSSMEREERDTRAEQIRRRRGGSGGVRDW